MTLLLSSLFALLGLVFGSFAGATVWRLRAKQIVQEKETNESVDKTELKRLKPLVGHGFMNDRSRCLHCGHPLAWYDLVPLVSWLSTKGRCRYCKEPIGWFEPVIEVATATLFVGVYLTHPVDMWVDGILLLGWLIATVMLVILFSYDSKWFLLPDSIMLPAGVVALIIAVEQILTSMTPGEQVIETLFSVLIIGGLYFLIWLGSKGNWIGFGDVKLGVVLGLLLGNWQLAVLALFLANLIGTLIVLPGLLTKKMSRTTLVPFGPMLIAGFFITVFFGAQIIDWYLSLGSGLAMTLML